MNRILLVAAAIAALFGGSICLVFVSTAQPWSTASPPSQPVAGPPLAVAAPAAAPGAPPVASALPARAPPRPGPVTARVSWSGAAKDPSSPPMAERVLRKAVRKALLGAAIHSQLARCADHAGGFGRGAAPGPLPGGRPASLMLQMETLAGEVRILDAEVQEWGEASEATISCARSVLRGQVIAAASNVPPGQRVAMPLPLNPRSSAVASSR